MRRLSGMQPQTVFKNPLAICSRSVVLAMRNTDMWRRPQPCRASDFVRANARSNTHPPLPVSKQVRRRKLCERNARPRHDYVNNTHGAPKNLQTRPAPYNYGVPDSDVDRSKVGRVGRSSVEGRSKVDRSKVGRVGRSKEGSRVDPGRLEGDQGRLEGG